MIKLDVTLAKIGMVTVLVKSKHEISFGFDPIDPVVLISNSRRVPESDFEACLLNLVVFLQKCCCLDVCDYLAKASP
ncbi:hypothetical protein ACOZ4N_01350 (plasmid) [Halorientalis pallida]|uniref:hypothetical protein n=1 Tax=Halorientalis pallida TaxID=2479928 RepID=UPI003C6EEF8E